MQCPESGRGGAGGEGGGRGRWGKREREAQRDELERQRKAAFARRDKAIKDNYAKWGCRVLKEDESWEGETREQAERWAEEVRLELLGKGEPHDWLFGTRNCIPVRKAIWYDTEALD